MTRLLRGQTGGAFPEPAPGFRGLAHFCAVGGARGKYCGSRKAFSIRGLAEKIQVQGRVGCRHETADAGSLDGLRTSWT